MRSHHHRAPGNPIGAFPTTRKGVLTMYIGGGTVVLILIIVLVVFLARR